MSVFGDYARYYELLYADKDYASETRFVKALLDQYVPGAESILELGCGGGRHAALLAETGLAVHGLDRSAEMLGQARARAAALPAAVRARLGFSEGDICSARLHRTFDAVTALFHVVSYLTTDADLRAAFETAAAHLRPGGVFLFDCWYGPAVLAQRPEVRVKRAEDETVKVTRLCEPEMLPGENSVIVHYTIVAEDKASGAVRVVREDHRMRYLFAPEVHALALSAGMRVTGSMEWLTGRAPGPDTWSACFVLEAGR